MKILVTGAAGFIGSHVCEHFIELGHFVVGVDNFDNFYLKKLKLLNLAELHKKNEFLFYEADIRDGKTLNKIFTSDNIDIVIHLAAKAGVRPSIDSIANYYDVNVNGTVFFIGSNENQ